MKKCAFLTLCNCGEFVIDDDQAIQPLEELGWKVSVVSWRQEETQWSDFDAVIIRSTWDYYNDVAHFKEVLNSINNSTRLANPLSLVNWNFSKTYLRELEAMGIAIVPTAWPEGLVAESLESLCEELASDEIVIKPVVGANGEDTFRFRRSLDQDRMADIVPLFAGRQAMAQRFMPAILTEGEYSLFFFNGEFSHAILKRPTGGEFRAQEERGSEILSVTPEPVLLQVALKALATIKTPLYARIDIIRDEAGRFLVMEFELIEPSLYLRTDPGAPARFAQAVTDWFNRLK